MIVIVGGSQLTKNLVRALSKLKEKVVFMMESKDEAMELSNETGAIGVVGDPSEPKDLDELELRSADVFIAATEREDTNVLAALYAKEEGAKSVFAEVRGRSTAKVLSKMGITPVDAEEQAARMIELTISRPGVAKLVSLGEAGMDIIEVVCRGTKLVGKTFGEVHGKGFHPVAVYKEGKLLVDESEKLDENSVLIIMCPVGTAERVRRSLA